MQTYLVRMIKDKTAFGIFWAEDLRELFMLIDEREDPGEFECLVVEDSGGLFFNDGYAKWKLGVKERPGPGRLDTVTRNITFSEEVNDLLLGRYEEGGFVPLSTMFELEQATNANSPNFRNRLGKTGKSAMKTRL